MNDEDLKKLEMIVNSTSLEIQKIVQQSLSSLKIDGIDKPGFLSPMILASATAALAAASGDDDTFWDILNTRYELVRAMIEAGDYEVEKSEANKTVVH